MVTGRFLKKQKKMHDGTRTKYLCLRTSASSRMSYVAWYASFTTWICEGLNCYIPFSFGNYLSALCTVVAHAYSIQYSMYCKSAWETIGLLKFCSILGTDVKTSTSEISTISTFLFSTFYICSFFEKDNEVLLLVSFWVVRPGIW